MVSLLASVGLWSLGDWRNYGRPMPAAQIIYFYVRLCQLVAIPSSLIDRKVAECGALLVDNRLVFTHGVTVTIALSVKHDGRDALEGLLFKAAPLKSLLSRQGVHMRTPLIRGPEAFSVRMMKLLLVAVRSTLNVHPVGTGYM